MPITRQGGLSAKKRRQRRKKLQKRYQQVVKIQRLKIKQLQKQSVLKHQQNASTMRILPEFDYDNVKEIPTASVKELQSKSGNSGKKFPQSLSNYKCAGQLCF